MASKRERNWGDIPYSNRSSERSQSRSEKRTSSWMRPDALTVVALRSWAPPSIARRKTSS